LFYYLRRKCVMAKRFAVLLVAFFCAAVFAQGLPKIAVYVTGDVSDNNKKALGTKMLAALVNSGRYKGIERSNSFLAEIEKEQGKQRDGSVDDSQISALGKQFGVRFVCVADINPAFDAFSVSARVVDVETAEVIHIGEADSPLKTIADLTKVAETVVKNMFKEQTLAVTIDPPNSGDVSVNPNKEAYNSGEQVTVTAAPREGFAFTGWSGASTSREAGVTFAMTGDKALTANFQPSRHTITAAASPPEGGSVTLDPNQANYAYGTNVNVKAAPAEGYAFSGWTGAVEDTATLVTITVNGDNTLTANFEKLPEPEPAPESKSSAPPPEEKRRKILSLGIGASYASAFGGGIYWEPDGGGVEMPYSGGGAYLFVDAVYAEAYAGISYCGGTWVSADVTEYDLPYMESTSINFGVFAKYPITLWKIKAFPLLGFEYELADGNVGVTGADMSTLWLKFGVGAEADLSKSLYLRTELLYGIREQTYFELEQADIARAQARPVSYGITFRIGAGIKL
jgi:uncharacterized repeat protein (TIGR02543 family)